MYEILKIGEEWDIELEEETNSMKSDSFFESHDIKPSYYLLSSTGFESSTNPSPMMKHIA